MFSVYVIKVNKDLKLNHLNVRTFWFILHHLENYQRTKLCKMIRQHLPSPAPLLIVEESDNRLGRSNRQRFTDL